MCLYTRTSTVNMVKRLKSETAVDYFKDDFYTNVQLSACRNDQSEPVRIQAVQCETHLLVLLEGGLELQVVPGSQDEAKSGLVCPKTTLTSLHHK